MTQSFVYSKQKLLEWQSSVAMIPVLLELLKEKLNAHSRIPSETYQAYQAIYHSWQQTQDLNIKQKEWIKEIGDYLGAIQQTLFRSHSESHSSCQAPGVRPNW